MHLPIVFTCTYIHPSPSPLSRNSHRPQPNMVGIKYNVKIVDVEPLVEGRWASWSHNMRFCFLEAGFVHYLNGMNALDKGDSKKVQTEWHVINS